MHFFSLNAAPFFDSITSMTIDIINWEKSFDRSTDQK